MTTITIDRAVVEQALEALEDVDGPITALLGGLLGSPEQDAPGAKVRASITALRAVLAQEQAELVAPERERWAILLRAAGRVLQAFDDGYLQLDPETLQGGIAVDALREAWGAFAPARIQGGQR